MLAGCDSGLPSLFIDLRTDLVPGVEVTSVRTYVELDRTIVAMAVDDLTSGDLVSGARIAEFDDLARGDYVVSVELEGPDGPVLARHVALTLNDTYVMTIVAARSCVGVVCPGETSPAYATECLAGTCVAPECIELGGQCGTRCASAADCGDAPSECGYWQCVLGACFATASASCDAGEVCIPDEGCVTDATPDAGMFDAGMGDAGAPSCATGCDDGNPCTQDLCVGGECTHSAGSGGCDDGDPCTHSDRCEAGRCAGTGYSCSPPPCMSASCDGSGGCSVGGGCGPGSVCDGSSCVACGGVDQRCCDAGGCNSGLWCYTGVCTCGQRGGPCCPWDGSCEGGVTCMGGTCCVPYGGSCAAGGPCCDAPCRSGICFN